MISLLILVGGLYNLWWSVCNWKDEAAQISTAHGPIAKSRAVICLIADLSITFTAAALLGLKGFHASIFGLALSNMISNQFFMPEREPLGKAFLRPILRLFRT